MPPEGALTKTTAKVWGGYKKVTGSQTPRGTPKALGAGARW